LHGRLSPADQALLASIDFADEERETEGEPQPVAQQALACLDAMEQTTREAEYGALKARIAAAQRAGDIAEALALAEQLERHGGAGRRRRSGGVE
jgi:hypothetical protein